jgi:methyl-accepting chemotaxis protein
VGLKFKFSLFIITLIFFILSAISFVLIQTRSKEIQKELVTRNTFLAQKIVPDLVSDIGDYYNFSYSKYVEMMKKRLQTYPDILHLSIYNLEGKQIFDTDHMTNVDGSAIKPFKITDPAVQKIFDSKQITTDISLYHNQQTIRIFIPYIDKYGTFRMFVEFHFSMREVRSTIQGVILFSVILLIVATALSVLLTLILVNQITSPILTLTKAVDDVRLGKLDFPVPTKSDDEIGKLSHTLVQMTAELKKSKEDQQSYNKNLEFEVDKRTKELREKMEEMQRLQKLTIDRELKMVELKDEIDRLRKLIPNKESPSS